MDLWFNNSEIKLWQRKGTNLLNKFTPVESLQTIAQKLTPNSWLANPSGESEDD